jgi:hypothetical protein
MDALGRPETGERIEEIVGRTPKTAAIGQGGINGGAKVRPQQTGALVAPSLLLLRHTHWLPTSHEIEAYLGVDLADAILVSWLGAQELVCLPDFGDNRPGLDRETLPFRRVPGLARLAMG